MRRKVLFFLPVVVLALLTLGGLRASALALRGGYAQLQPVGPDNTPKVGKKAPDFELAKGLNPKEGTLGMKDFLGKKRVLLAFYQADFNAG